MTWFKLNLGRDLVIFKYKANNILHGIINFLLNKNKELYKERIQHCRGCEHNGVVKCLNCGCVKQFKLRVDNENCPIDKW